MLQQPTSLHWRIAVSRRKFFWHLPLVNRRIWIRSEFLSLMEASSNAVIHTCALDSDVLQYCIVFIVWLIFFLLWSRRVYPWLPHTAHLLYLEDCCHNNHDGSFLILPSALPSLSSISSYMLRKSYYFLLCWTIHLSSSSKMTLYLAGKGYILDLFTHYKTEMQKMKNPAPELCG